MQQGKLSGDSLPEHIAAGMPVEDAGSSIADEIFSRFYAVPAGEIKDMR